MHILNMKKKDFDSVPVTQSNNKNKIWFTDLVVIPISKKHESGYKCMKYCACNHGEPIAMFDSNSDVIDLNSLVSTEKNIFWKMDCLPCGYTHLWCVGHELYAYGGRSNFEVFAEKKKGE